MTTLIVQLPPALAKRLAAAADRQALTHSEIGRLAIELFLRAERAQMNERTNERTNEAHDVPFDVDGCGSEV